MHVNTIFQASLNILGWAGVSNTLVSYDNKTNRYSRRSTPWFCKLAGVIIRVNYISKVIYLTLLLFGFFPDTGFEFLDYLTIGFWYLVTMLILIGESFWFRTCPFFEIVCAGWDIQNEVFRKISQPQEYRKVLEIAVGKKVVFQL